MRSKTAILAVAVALLATACFRSDIRIRVEDDGSGEIEALIALDVETALEFSNAFAGDDIPEVTREDVCSDFEAEQDIPEGATVTPYEEDGFCGISYTLAFGPDEFQDAIGEAAAGDQFELRREGEGWYFETDLTNEDLAGGEDAGAELLTESFLESASLTFGVLLPGRLVEHNASYIDTDGTAVWEVDLAVPSTNIFARTEPGERILGEGSGDGGGGSAVTIIIVLVVLAAAAAGVWWWIKRRRESDSADTGSSLGPPGSAPGASPPGSPPGVPPAESPPGVPPPAAPGSGLPPPDHG